MVYTESFLYFVNVKTTLFLIIVFLVEFFGAYNIIKANTIYCSSCKYQVYYDATSSLYYDGKYLINYY